MGNGVNLILFEPQRTLLYHKHAHNADAIAVIVPVVVSAASDPKIH